MNSRSKRRPVFLRLFLSLFVLIVSALGCTMWILSSKITLSGDGFVYVPRNSSIRSAVDSVLMAANVPSEWLVLTSARIVARVRGGSVKAGWYQLKGTDNSLDILVALFSGHRRPTIRVTIPEGKTYREIASILLRVAEIDSSRFVHWCESDSVVHYFNVDAATMEGYLMPDTYDVYWRDDPEALATLLAVTFQSNWNSQAEGDLASTGRSQHDVVTLASIVQAEAAVPGEMERIAGVYTNRLRIGMRLEADPTVQYGLGVRKRLTYADLEQRTDYNTYRNAGLPPGPINNPGFRSIQAALRPEQHSYLFFVAEGDGSGRHRFSKSGQEHLRNVQVYRRRRASK